MYRFLLNSTSILLLVFWGNISHAETKSVVNDQLSSLIQKVQYESNNKEIVDSLDKQLARASWKIQCWTKKFEVLEDNKICMMRKDDLIVMHFNDDYILSVGIKHQQNSTTDIRIDNNSVIQANEGLYRDAIPVINQMKKGISLFSKHQVQDKSKSTERTISLIGFTDAFNDMELQYKQLVSNVSVNKF